MHIRPSIVGAVGAVLGALLLMTAASAAGVVSPPILTASVAAAPLPSGLPSALPSAPQAEFVPITPCRYLDTRSEGGTFSGAISRSYPRRCGVPAYAKSLAVSISAVGPDRQRLPAGRS